MTGWRGLFFGVLIAASLAAPLRAQGLADFEPDLLRVSEILGAVTYLDGLCGTPESEQWRVKMEALIDAQQMPPENRRRYVDAFNRGYRTTASIHRSCGERVRFLIERYLDEGATIIERLGSRYGGQNVAPANGPVTDLGNTPAPTPAGKSAN